MEDLSESNLKITMALQSSNTLFQAFKIDPLTVYRNLMVFVIYLISFLVYSFFFFTKFNNFAVFMELGRQYPVKP